MSRGCKLFTIAAAAVLFLILFYAFLFPTRSITLYEYALTLKNDDLFLGHSSSMPSSPAGIFAITEELDDGNVIIEETGRWVTAQIANPHDIADASELPAGDLAAYISGSYIRSDGSIWVRYSTTSDIRLTPLYSCDEFSANNNRSLSISLNDYDYDKRLKLEIKNNSSEAIEWAYAYLFVQGSDGRWYLASPLITSDVVPAHYIADGEYIGPMGSKCPHIMSNDSKHSNSKSFFFSFGQLTGHYRIGVFSNSYGPNPDHYLGKPGAYYVPLFSPDSAQLIATIDFDYIRNGKDPVAYYSFTNFESSVADFTVR